MFAGRRSFGIAAAALLVGGRRAAAAWPTRPIRFVVPFSAGGASDIVARTVAARMAERLGQGIVVENRTGGGIIIGSEAVATAAPDGHTVLVGVGTLTILPSLRRPPGFDVRQSFAPITPLVELPYVILAHRAVPFGTLPEMIGYAKQHPGKLNWASNGQGTMSHLVGELFRQRAEIDIVHVPYRGSGPQTTALLAGDVQLSIDGVGPTLPQIRDGAIKVLAITAERPSAALPQVPLAGATLPGFSPGGWIGLMAPAGTPSEAIAALYATAREVMAEPAIQARFIALGFDPLTMPPDAFRRRIAAEVEDWRQVILRSGLVLD